MAVPVRPIGTAKPTNSVVTVASAADANYALPLAVMLHSVGAHAGPDVRIEAHVLDDGVPAEEKRKVAASLPPNVSLEWRQSAATLTGLPTWGRMPLTTYHKLTLADWISDGPDRLIWLDCDLLVLEDISRLWETESDGHIALAVGDQRVPRLSSQFGVTAWQELGLPEAAKYFNAGVMVIDMARWREQDVGRRSLEYVKTYGDRIYFWDQEALNAVLAGKWGELDECWNQHPWLNHLPGQSRPGSASATAKEASETKGILHFSGNLKPWNLGGNGHYQTLYRSYLDRTAWAEQRPSYRWQDSILVWYKTSRLRGLFYPAERLATIVERYLTLKIPK
jgi:lipopolysaccharide biosynthesis glycosyltransferase